MDASKPRNASSVIQLKEHLQRQQEPFSLQNYLEERGYYISNNCNFDISNIHTIYSAKNLKWSIKCDLRSRKRNKFLHATSILRTLLYKFIPASVDNQGFSNLDEEHNNDDPSYYGPQTNELFSLERLALSDYLTNNDDGKDSPLPYEHHSSTLDDIFQTFTFPKSTRSEEVDAGSKPYWTSSEKDKEHYNNKALECEEALPNAVHHPKSPESYLRKLLVHSNILKFGCAMKKRSRRKRRIMQKREQLLFEIAEKDRRVGENEGITSISMKVVSECDDLESIMEEHFRLLEKQYRGRAKKMSHNHMVHTESCCITLTQEWESLQIVNREKIHMEIGDAILDDIVTETIIDLF